MIKLLLGGSPCTYWSIAQSKSRETKAEGMGWELFKNYLIAKEKFKPDFFLYENNWSASKDIKEQIQKELCCDLMRINSALVSAQNRDRFYVFNWDVNQPEDRGIMLRDILETGEPEKERSTHHETVRVGTYPKKDGNLSNSKQYRVYSQDGKSTTLCGEGGGLGAKTGLYAIEAESLAEEYYKGGFESSLIGMIENDSKCRNGKQPSQQYRVYSSDDKSVCLDTDKRKHYTVPLRNGRLVKGPVYAVKDGYITIKDKKYPIKLEDGNYTIRKLTPVECERLQTLPDGYTAAVSNTQRYRGLGNGWTAEVIIHILQGALKDVPKDEKIVVLSMYDGIGTGRYCLDKMGFTNVEYHAYEIDKYAIKVSMSNYPDIVQHGDAFQVRENDWKLEE